MLQSWAVEAVIQGRPVTKQHDELRGIVREWLEFIQQKYGITPRKIATRSNVSPSTIYRWLDEDAPFVMSMSKLRQVADAFGENLPEALTGMPAGARPGFAETDLAPYDAAPGGAAGKVETNHGRWRITSDVLDMEGFRVGDVLDFDMGLEPRAGDVVVAQVYNMARGTAETLLRLYQPPFLLTRSSDRRIDARPLYVDGERVVVMGTFVRLIRERAA
jgi:transcriptional regulator with XRE-family HTH domain